MKADKSVYIIWVILLLLVCLHYNTYHGWLSLAFFGVCLLVTTALTRSRKFSIKSNAYAHIVITVLACMFIPNIIAHKVVSKHRQTDCGVISEVKQSFWRADTFLLKGNPTNFSLKRQAVEIGDKVCVTYNPNEKWYGYAYVFELKKHS
ncbi:hypothetical protein LU290_10475 [Moraxella nasibovis]|uniref:hypothetical protein n=1 Tax=Moraxella nasibovis TaxID=2904120 RepID=UPI0024101C93|nr:hypothetical protein [Moraxella nasibovis]WFF38643.1 hypothetical protein LU290_10475 [Moraxella nasibovis]